MHITELRIRNYRNFLNARFRFKPGVNTLIGENGSGKTNVFQALRLLLDESLERGAINLRESDFCRELGDWRGHWVVISADFAELDSSEGCQTLRHTAGHMNGSNTGTCTYIFRPKKEVRKRMCGPWESRGAFEEYRKALVLTDYEAVFTGRAVGDCLHEETYGGWTGCFDEAACPDPDRDDLDSIGVRIPAIYQEVACTFVRALRDVISDLKGFRGNPLLTLLRGMEKDIDIKNAALITGQVQKLNQDISSLDEIRSLASDIEGALKKAVGHTYGPGVEINSSLPDSMEKLLQRLGLLVGDSDVSNHKGELHEQSLGVANLIYLSLKHLEYERKLSSDRVAHFFLIEEPEAHIHTHIQKTLFGNLPTDRTQVIVSTHSTHISSAAKIESVNVLAKVADHAEVYQPSNGLGSTETKRVERYLDAIRSTLLFAKGVLLTEGDAELIVIPALLRAAFDVSSDELGFSLISMNSAFFEHISVLFSSERIRRPCAILTDGDASLLALSDDYLSDSKAQAKARSAQAAGQRRRKSLEGQASTNSWVRPFIGESTFEIEFIRNSNGSEVISMLNEIYVDPKARAQSEELLRSAEVKSRGLEMLRLAEKVGKGWFALLLAERVQFATPIPRYILDAVAFACHKSLSDPMLRRMAEFRLLSIVKMGDQSSITASVLVERRDADTQAFLASYQSTFPEDALTEFIGYVRSHQSQ